MVRSILFAAILGTTSFAGHVQGTLVSEHASVLPGGRISLGLHLKMEPGWHVYWTNPGDAGIHPGFVWKETKGAVPDSLKWPVPDTIPVFPLMTYGYGNDVLLPFEAKVDSGAKGSVVLKGMAKWLECHDICVPGKAEFSLDLPVSSAAPVARPETSGLFAQARQELPVAAKGWTIRAAVSDSFVWITAKAPRKPATQAAVRFLPLDQGVIDNAAAQRWVPVADGFRLKIHRDPYAPVKRDTLRGLLVREPRWEEGAKALEFSVPLVPATAGDTVDFRPPAPRASAEGGGFDQGLFMALFFAFLGGIVLNLMPCVLPVLSLKVLDFLKKGGRSRGHVFGHGLVFSAGAILSFLALAVAMLALRGGGEALGWGFQMQSPRVVALISLLMAVLAFSFWGVFEPGASFASKAGEVRGSGWIGSFLTGVTATIVATPCTAPFMGVALGYTLTRPPVETLSVFFFLGLGMSAPYLLLSAFPALVSRLPRPGAWMETLKQIFGFAMAGTAVWLAWVAGRLSGADAVVLVAATWLVAGAGSWILGRWALPHRSAIARWIARSVFVLALAMGVAAVVAFLPVRTGAVRAEGAKEGLVSEPFKDGTLAELRASGRPWFLYFTADWCLSCQVNERLALERREVVEAFGKSGVRVVKADWTGRDSLIARTLAEFGRQGVPFYVLSDGRTETFLPELLTPGIVEKSLEKIH